MCRRSEAVGRLGELPQEIQVEGHDRPVEERRLKQLQHGVVRQRLGPWCGQVLDGPIGRDGVGPRAVAPLGGVADPALGHDFRPSTPKDGPRHAASGQLVCAAHLEPQLAGDDAGDVRMQITKLDRDPRRSRHQQPCQSGHSILLGGSQRSEASEYFVLLCPRRVASPVRQLVELDNDTELSVINAPAAPGRARLAHERTLQILEAKAISNGYGVLPRDIPAADDRQGLFSVSGTTLHVKGHFFRTTRHPETLRDSPKRSATTSTHEYWNPMRRHLTM